MAKIIEIFFKREVSMKIIKIAKTFVIEHK